MSPDKSRKYFLSQKTAMAYLSVRTRQGDESIGSAFHVGEGVFVTARHVLEKNKILEVRLSEDLQLPYSEVFPEYPAEGLAAWASVLGGEPTFPTASKPLKITFGPVYHPDPTVDIAAFKVDRLHPTVPAVSLGSHLDDWIRDDDWLLSEAAILGYPPIPMTIEPYLVIARAEVNAIIGLRDTRHPHFILSAIPRGGFSGGLALSEYGFALGVITQSLLSDGKPPENGFFCVTSIEPIYVCLAHHKILPDNQKNAWDGLWNSETTDFTETIDNHSELLAASVSRYDDGKRQYIEVHSAKVPTLVDTLLSEISTYSLNVEYKRSGWIRIDITSVGKSVADVVSATAESLFLKTGYHRRERK